LDHVADVRTDCPGSGLQFLAAAPHSDFLARLFELLVNTIDDFETGMFE